MINRISVLFPGVGYNKHRSLLYYSGKMAEQYDYKIKSLEFTGFPFRLKTDRDALMKAFQIVVAQSEKQLKFIDFSAYDDIVFISKSIGTVAASIYAQKYNIPARQLYFTPLEHSFSLIEDGNGLVFHGTNDSWVDTPIVEEKCLEKHLTLKIIESGNHSLETGNVFADLKELSVIMEDVNLFLKNEPIQTNE